MGKIHRCCSTCYYRVGNECRNAPPVVIATPKTYGIASVVEVKSKWPTVEESDWCGSWAKQVGEHNGNL